MTDTFLTAPQLAARLGVSRQTVLRWAKAGRIPHIRASCRLLRFALGEVVDALRATKGPARPGPRAAERES